MGSPDPTAHPPPEAQLRDGALGIVEATNQRGFRVTSATENDLRDILLMRLEVEKFGLTRSMERGDVAELGELLNAGHNSLRVDFEVSSPALDGMVECARRLESCYGARMTGAGFGGCAVALVRSDGLSGFASEVAACFAKSFDSEASIFPVKASDGASVEAV